MRRVPLKRAGVELLRRRGGLLLLPAGIVALGLVALFRATPLELFGGDSPLASSAGARAKVPHASQGRVAAETPLDPIGIAPAVEAPSPPAPAEDKLAAVRPALQVLAETEQLARNQADGQLLARIEEERRRLISAVAGLRAAE